LRPNRSLVVESKRGLLELSLKLRMEVIGLEGFEVTEGEDVIEKDRGLEERGEGEMDCWVEME